MKAAGLAAFKVEAAKLMATPVAADGIKSFDDVSLLSVSVDRLERWRRPDFLAIGDAAHAMSPIGGVGVNLAVQDAVAAANRLAAPLLAGGVSEDDLAAIERRRLLPTRVIQFAQVAAQNTIIVRTLAQTAPLKAPLIFRLASRSALLHRLLGRLIGLGVRPEHVRTPQASTRPA